jgi:hypothetical protein
LDIAGNGTSTAANAAILGGSPGSMPQMFAALGANQLSAKSSAAAI